jgi:hypothetical protein
MKLVHLIEFRDRCPVLVFGVGEREFRLAKASSKLLCERGDRWRFHLHATCLCQVLEKGAAGYEMAAPGLLVTLSQVCMHCYTNSHAITLTCTFVAFECSDS